MSCRREDRARNAPTRKVCVVSGAACVILPGLMHGTKAA
jgi:hypothetical protein